MSVSFFLTSAQAETVYDGIDVSVFQGEIDFEAVRADGIDAVYIRAGQGADITDERFRENYPAAAAAGLIYGFYFVLEAEDTDAAVSQAERFAALISGTGYTARPAMDYESFGSLSPASDRDEINAIALAFLMRLRELTGTVPMVYTDVSRADTLWSEALGAYPVWLAEYGAGETPPETAVWDDWTGFQFSDSGTVSGITGSVDLDRFRTGILLDAGEAERSGQSTTERFRYVVKSGDTLWAISRRFGTTVRAIVQANGIANPDLIYPGEVLYIPLTESGGGGMIPAVRYTVRCGDTLWALSRRFGTTVEAIARENGIANPDLIYVGEELYITPGRETDVTRYTVRCGDTLWALSRRFGTTVEAIARENGIANPDLIYAGEVLIIP